MNSSLSVNHGSGADIGPPTPGQLCCFCFAFRSRHSLCDRCFSLVPVHTNCCVELGFVLPSGLR